MGNCNNSTMAHLMMKYGGKPMEITPGCKLTCSKVLTDIVTCGTKTIGNRTLLNVLYFLFRYVLSKHVHAYLTIFLTIEWWDFKTWDVMKHFFCNNNSVILLTSSKFDNSGFFINVLIFVLSDKIDHEPLENQLYFPKINAKPYRVSLVLHAESVDSKYQFLLI